MELKIDNKEFSSRLKNVCRSRFWSVYQKIDFKLHISIPYDKKGDTINSKQMYGCNSFSELNTNLK